MEVNEEIKEGLETQAAGFLDHSSNQESLIQPANLSQLAASGGAATTPTGQSPWIN
jgi:hypothetical protein